MIHSYGLLALIFLSLFLLEHWRPLRISKDLIFFRLIKNVMMSLVALPCTSLLTLPLLIMLATASKRNEMSAYTLIIGLVIFDYLMYWWHVALHRLSFLWRFHQVHHSDLDLDSSTALRFHFGELILSLLPRSLFIIIMGAGIEPLLIIDVIFTAFVLFHHSNLALPSKLERFLLFFMVTPLYHQEHHSQFFHETNSNFSSIFSLWDRLHHSQSKVRSPHEIKIGLPYFKRGALFLADLLVMPLKRPGLWPKELLERPYN